jgi:very-short-patch-repair endonuclease
MLRPDVSSTRPKTIDGITLQRGRALRKEATDAETRLWYALRERPFGGLKFRRQYPLGKYIVDFCCVGQRLIIELDGSQHADQKPYDDARTSELRRYGYRVVRFWNFEVSQALSEVLDRIEQAIGDDSAPSPGIGCSPLPTSPATKRARHRKSGRG